MRSFPDTPFFRRKVCQRTSHQIHQFILVKLLKFQGTFLEKSFVSGFGADAPTDNAYTKSTALPCFLFFINSWNCVRGPCFKGLFVKSPLKIRKNFPPNTYLYFGEAFEVPRDFSRKVPCVGGRRPDR